MQITDTSKLFSIKYNLLKFYNPFSLNAATLVVQNMHNRQLHASLFLIDTLQQTTLSF